MAVCLGMEIRQLEYFLAVADAGSITAAAAGLHMTQPPLSLAIGKLEGELGVRLFERRARGVALTEAGEHLRSAGQRLVEEQRSLTTTMRRLGEGLAGELRIAAGPIVYWAYLAQRIATFSARHPDVQLMLRDPAPAELLEEMARRTVDIGIVACAEPEILALDLAPELQTQVVTALPLRLAAPATWPALPDVVDVADLLDEPWILPARAPRFPGLPEVVDVVFARAGRRPTRILEVPTPQTSLPLIAAGVGLAVITEHAADHLPAVRTHAVKGGWPPLFVTIVWPRDDAALTPLARVFLDELLAAA